MTTTNSSTDNLSKYLSELQGQLSTAQKDYEALEAEVFEIKMQQELARRQMMDEVGHNASSYIPTGLSLDMGVTSDSININQAMVVEEINALFGINS